MGPVSEEKVKEAINSINGLDREMVSGVQIAPDGHVMFMIEVDPDKGTDLEPLRQDAEKIVAQIAGVSRATAILTAQKKAPSMPPPRRKKMDPHPDPNPGAPIAPGVKRIIAVASGKGGVGKSTLSANLAVAMAQSGLTVGLLDADIYGPSQPRMMGLAGQKPDSDKNQNIIPLEAHGIKVMSIGFMVEEEKALIWRGPMVQSALLQLLRDVAWGEMDVLLVDMPPGTGDAQLTMAQKVPLAGAIIVSTPQDIALIDARKAIAMFQKVNVPILGIIENMSIFCCPNCGHETPIFGHGGAEADAKRLDVTFLGAVPLVPDIRLHGDDGTPYAVTHPDAFRDIVKKL